MAVKTILICTEDILPGAKFMHDKLGRYDLLGQILFTGYRIKVHKFAIHPASQGTLLAPFTVMARKQVHCTPLCITLLKNAETLSGLRQLKAANILLDSHCILLEQL